jgi:hypothetical protein
MKHTPRAAWVALNSLFWCTCLPAFGANASPIPAPTARVETPTPSLPRALKPEDFAALRDVDEPNISPDGNLVVYVVKVADMEKDKRPAIFGWRNGTDRRIAR